MFCITSKYSFRSDVLRNPVWDDLAWIFLPGLANDAVLFSSIGWHIAQLVFRETAMFVNDFVYRFLVNCFLFLMVDWWLVPVIKDCLFSFLVIHVADEKIEVVVLNWFHACDCRRSLLIESIVFLFWDKPSWTCTVNCDKRSLCSILISTWLHNANFWFP